MTLAFGLMSVVAVELGSAQGTRVGSDQQRESLSSEPALDLGFGMELTLTDLNKVKFSLKASGLVKSQTVFN